MSEGGTSKMSPGASTRDDAAIARLTEPIVTARLLVVVAHPDDETIGAGALLARSVDAHIAVVTDGAPRQRSMWPAGVTVSTRQEYVQIRREELLSAVAAAGIGFDRVYLLGIADGEATERIPLIVHHLLGLFDKVAPDIILTHAYEGGHVDHDATALAVHAAMTLAGRGRPYEMALYHGAGDTVAVHDFLPDGPPARTFRLDDGLRARKSGMLECYQSQRHHKVYFGTDVERYRHAPPYDFRKSPDPIAPLLYERNGRTTGDEWRACVRGALTELQWVDWLDGRPFDRPGTEAASHDAPALGPSIPPLVSVIVRTIGRETLAEALDSIAHQTYANIEIVIVDVSGRDLPGSWQGREGLVLRRIEATGFDRPKAANAGLRAATGRYIAFLDDDDWFYPQHVFSLVAALRANSAARVAYSGVEAIEWVDGSPSRRWVFDSPYDSLALLCENYIPLNAVLLDRGVLDESGRFDETLSLFEDWDFLIWLSRRTAFERVPGIGAGYRWPPGSGINDPERTADWQTRIFSKWRDTLAPEEYVTLVRRAIEQTELKDGRQSQMEALQEHLRAQDDELNHLRSLVGAQDQQLARLRAHLGMQDEELGRLRPQASIQEQQLDQLRRHLKAQDDELEALRPCVSAQEAQLEKLRVHLTRLDEQLQTSEATISSLTRALGEAQDRLRVQDEALAVLRAQIDARNPDVRRPVSWNGD